jgi:hypothetical protein
VIRIAKARVAKKISVNREIEENCGDPELDGCEMEIIFY